MMPAFTIERDNGLFAGDPIKSGELAAYYREGDTVTIRIGDNPNVQSENCRYVALRDIAADEELIRIG